MIEEIRNELLGILSYLQKKRSVVASQDDLIQVIRVVQYLLTEEAIIMSDNVPFERGHELGEALAHCFEVKGDGLAFQNLGLVLAPLFGYDHLNTGRAFLMGLAKGVDETRPRLLGDGKQE